MRAAFLVLVPGLLLAGDVYQAPSPEPTAEETLILELMNRFRADPKAEAEWIVKTYAQGDKVMGADAKLFLEECGQLKAMPPLVFNLRLLDAARKHSQYMIFNGLGHVEEPAKRGFTGASFGDRAKAAGYEGFAAAENAFAGSSGALNSHVGFIIDFGPGGTGGMQPGRGHRMNMIGGYREVGPGGVPNGNGTTGLSVTHDMGSSKAARLVGGVVYVDRNGNGFYDPGEGKGNVTIMAADGSRTPTWASGAYTLELKSAGAVALKIDYHGQTLVKEFAAGQDNIGFSFAIPQQTESDLADRLLAEVDKEATDTPPRFKAQVALALAAPELLLDQSRHERIAAAIGTVGADLGAAQQGVRDAFAADPSVMKKLIATHGKTYRGTNAAAWFKEADLAYKASLSVQGYLKQAAVAKPSPTMERDLLKSLEQAQGGLQVGEFASRLGALAAQVRGAGNKS